MVKTKEKSLIKSIFKIIEFLIMVVIFFISAVIVIQRVTNNQYAFLGFRIFRVETGSMIPKYNIADVILVKEKNIDSIKVGEDLVYIGEAGQTVGKIITHQIIRIDVDKDGNKVFYTKGLANSKEDPAVYGRQVLGVVTQKLQTLTWVMHLLLNRYTLYFIIILPFTIYIFFMELYGKEKKIRKEIRTRNKKANEKAEKEALKKNERERRRLERKLNSSNIKRIGVKETARLTEKTAEEPKEETKKVGRPKKTK